MKSVVVPWEYWASVAIAAEAREVLTSSDGARWLIEDFWKSLDPPKMTATFVEIVSLDAPLQAPRHVRLSQVLALPFLP